MTKKVSLILCHLVAALFVSLPALAEEGSAAAGMMDSGLVAVGAGVVLGLAALGGGIGQGLAISAGLSALGRNPSAADKVQTNMIIGLVFIETLVIFSFVIAFFLQGKF